MKNSKHSAPLKKAFWAFLFALLCLPCHLYAMAHAVQSFNYLTTADGFDNNTIWAIHQDAQGFMWFGTQTGLYKYDGNQLKAIHKDFFGNNREGSVVGKINEDVRNHRLWMEVENHIFTLDLQTEQVEHEPIELTDYINSIWVDHQGLLWVLHNDHVLTYDKSTGKQSDWEVPEVMKGKNIKKLLQDDHQLYYFLTLDAGVFVFDAQKKLVRQFAAPTPEAISFLYDSLGQLWLGTWRGLWRWDPQTRNFVKQELNDSQKTLFAVTEILEKSPGVLYLSTDSGLYTYDVRTGEIVQYKADYMQNGTLNCNYLNTIYLDRENTLWVGTYFGGVNYLIENSQNFLTYDFINLQMGGHVVSSFAEDEKGNLWIGTEDGGVSFYDRQRQQVTNYNPQEGPQPFLDFFNVHALLLDGDWLYIGITNAGLSLYNTRTKAVRRVTSSSPEGYSLSSNNIFSFAKTGTGTVAIGTEAGLNLYDPQSHRIRKVPEIPASDVNSILLDHKGCLWVCGKKMGVYYQEEGKNWQKFTALHETIQSDAVYTMTEVGSALYFGTKYQGIVAYDTEHKTFQHLLQTPLEDETVHFMVNQGDHLWFTTTNGLYLYHPKSKELHHYKENYGLKSKQTSKNAGILTRDGTVFIGTINGLNGFDINKMVFNTTAPQTVFTSLIINNEKALPGAPGSPLQRIMPHTQKITLTHTQSNLTLEFASLSYTGKQEKRYRYRLSPEDKGWVYTQSNTANFNHLKPGEYQLTVQSCNNNGVWDKTGCTLTLIQLPPWWLSWYMFVIYGLLLLCLIGYCVYLVKRKQEKRIEEINIRKEKEIYQSKMDFFTRIVHDIRTPLTLILSPLQALQRREDTLPFKFELDIMERNSQRLLNHVNQLMDFRKAEQETLNKNDWKPLDVVGEIREISAEFQLAATQKHIRLEGPAAETAPCYVLTDKDLFGKIFTNLLSNALKFTRSEIRIAVSADEQQCTLSVEDNGKGIPTALQSSIFEPFYQANDQLPHDNIGTGIGLSIVKHLVTQLGGTLALRSEVGQGAIFSVSFPLTLERPLAPSAVPEEQTVADSTDLHEERREEKEEKQWSVAVAEDNDDMRAFITALLEPLYNVHAYPDGTALLEGIRNESVDLVISDVMMPGIDGFQLCRQLKNDRDTCHLPVLLLTARVMEEDEIKGLEGGADAYLRKPFSTDLLLARVQNLIRNRERLLSAFREKPEMQLVEVIEDHREKEFAEKLNKIIYENLTNPQLNAAFVASELCLCRTLFFSKIKRITGMSFVDYVRIARLKRAVELLNEQESSMNEIAEKVGFSSMSYFYRCFKKQFNETPTEYLKKRLGKN